MDRKEDVPEKRAITCCSVDISLVDSATLHYGRTHKEPFYLVPVSYRCSRLFLTRICYGALVQEPWRDTFEAGEIHYINKPRTSISCCQETIDFW